MVKYTDLFHVSFRVFETCNLQGFGIYNTLQRPQPIIVQLLKFRVWEPSPLSDQGG